MPESPAGVEATGSRRHLLPVHGLIGLAIMFLGEIFMLAQINPVYEWFTPVQWTGYILLLDALLLKWRGTSFIMAYTREFVAMAFFSVVYWFMFEGYNLHLRNWAYVNLPQNFAIRLAGFIWAFATVYPGILLTNEVLQALGLFKHATFKFSAKKHLSFPNWLLNTFIVFGFLCCTLPLLIPQAVAKFLFVFVWIGFIFLLDPMNYRAGLPSLLGEFERGSLRTMLTLFVAGIICGFLWEFWNYWAGTKWVYTVPYFNKPKIFEMPLYGYLGFMAFAVECFTMWQFTRGYLPASWKKQPRQVSSLNKRPADKVFAESGAGE